MDLKQIPKDDDLLWTAYNMYKTSDLSPVLKSEKNRTVFAENFEIAQAPSLSTQCLNVIAQHYKGRPITLNLSPIQTRIFYGFVPELPIAQCVNIDNEFYWKRIFALKCTNQMELKKKTMQKNVCWKDLVLALKFTELIEETPYETWNVEVMEKVTKIVAPYVRELRILKLQGKRESTFLKAMMPSESTLDENEDEEVPADEEGFAADEKPDEEEEKEEEPEEKSEKLEPTYAIEDCHHGDLSLFKFLTNMTSLTVQFVPPELGIHYHSRYFNFSYVDMQNLANGVSELSNLKTFIIRRSRMDSSKLSTILEALKSISVKHIEFYFCQLDDECGESLYEYLMATSCLEHLNLSGNYFRDGAIDYLRDGIKNGPSRLKYLGLSNNPIVENNLCSLLETLHEYKTLSHLTLSGINVSKKGSECIAKLIKVHQGMEEMEIIAVPMNANSFIKGLNENKKIQHLLCQGCGLTINEEFQIELLLKRNRYIKANPYIGDPTKTEEEIVAFVSRVKNPILLTAMATKEKREKCLKARDELDEMLQTEELAEEGKETFVYKSKEFTEEELDQRVILYGQNNTNFFKKKSHGSSLDNFISMETK